MQTVPLNARHFPCDGAAPLIILHGLLGSSRNWMTAGKALSETFDTWALDLRNHGDSPHADTMEYAAMSADVIEWMDRNALDRVHCIGHSMGGKTAMRIAASHPERIDHLMIEDIAPVEYEPRWEREFEVMKRLPVASLKSRSDAEKALEQDIKDWAFRKFLTTNLERNSDGDGLRWTINLDCLHRCLDQLFGNSLSEGETYAGPTLFVRGDRSRFLTNEHVPAIRTHFPNATLRTVDNAHHNVHFDNLDGFLKIVREFIGAQSPAS